MLPNLAGVLLGATLLAGAVHQPDFKPFTSEEGRFRVQMPDHPVVQDQTQQTPAGPLTIHMVLKDLGKVAYNVSYFELPNERDARTDEQVLDDARGGAITNVQGTLIAERPASVKGYAGRAFEFALPPQDGDEWMGKIRMFVVGRRLYFLQVVGRKDEVNATSADTFLNSFQLLDSVPEAGPKPAAGRGASSAGGARAAEWTRFSSPTGRFAVMVPGTPGEQIKEDRSPNGTSSQSHIFEVGVRSSGARKYLLPTSYGVVYEDLPNPIPAARTATFFDRLQREVAGRLKGDVVNQRDITLDGVPGREVTIKIPAPSLPGGAVLRDRMYLVRQRVYQVLVQIPTGNEGDTARFFDSFRLLGTAPADGADAADQGPGDRKAEPDPAPPSPDVKPFTSEDGRFRILVPGNPDVKEQVQQTPAGPITIHSVVKDLGKVAYIVSYFDSPIQQEERTDDQILDDARGGAIANVQGTLIAERPVSVKGYAGRAFEFTLPPQGGAEGMGKARMYVVGKRLYILQAIGQKAGVDTAASDKFLGSFQLLDSVPEAKSRPAAGRGAPAAGGARAAEWTRFSSPTGRFAVMMPEAPKEQVQEDKTPAGPPIRSHLFEVGVRGSGARKYLLPTSYAVVYSDLEAAPPADQAANLFENVQRGVAESMQGRVTRQRDLALDNFPGREVTIQLPDTVLPGGAVVQDRIYLVNQRLYQVLVRVPTGNDSDAAKFFDSFRLLGTGPAAPELRPPPQP